MKSHIEMLVLLIGLAIGQVAATADDVGRPQAERYNTATLFDDAADGRLDDFTLLEAALVAGGEHRPEAIERSVSRFIKLQTLVRSQAQDIRSKVAAARVVFHLMHQHILTGSYRLDASSVAGTLGNGDYNCLSATIIYQCLCDEIDLPVKPVARPGHVRSRLSGESNMEIEPTCAQWFDRRNHVPSANVTEKAMTITSVQLIARVYYNRATQQLSNRQFAIAIQLLKLCTQLDPQHVASRTNLLAAYNNWALELCDTRQYAAAAQRLQEGLALSPHHEPFLANDLYVHGRWVRDLYEQGEFQQALAILEAGRRRRPDAIMFDRGRFLIVDAWAEAIAANGQRQIALAEAERHVNLLIDNGQTEMAKRLREHVQSYRANSRNSPLPN